MKNKNFFTMLAVVFWGSLSCAEDMALDGPDAAASIIEADSSGDVKSMSMPPEMLTSAEPNSGTSVDAEEEPSLDESEDTVPSGEDFFVVDPPSDFSAPDAPDSTVENKD